MGAPVPGLVGRAAAAPILFDAFARSGFAPPGLSRGARAGDALVLTKPLGVGVTVCAGRADALAEEGARAFLPQAPAVRRELDEVVRVVMTTLNRAASEAMEGLDVHAATDVTGYGLLGHAHEMMDAFGHDGRVRRRKIPLLSPARRLAGRGIAPDGFRVNVRQPEAARRDRGRSHRGRYPTLCDAQTSGGLLVASSRGVGRGLRGPLPGARRALRRRHRPRPREGENASASQED